MYRLVASTLQAPLAERVEYVSSWILRIHTTYSFIVQPGLRHALMFGLQPLVLGAMRDPWVTRHPRLSGGSSGTQKTLLLVTRTPHAAQKSARQTVSWDPTTTTSMSQVNIPYSEFAPDVEQKLGRANGNMFLRRPGVEGQHDGQVMVRLKKKRFVVLDYSIVPNDEDLKLANLVPHIKIPKQAGRAKCSRQGVGTCTRASKFAHEALRSV